MDKLLSLREFMKFHDLSALLIPRTDEFQGEYIAPYAERLAWLTGFTGSAGFAVITPDRAAFFTDGRYVLQAKEEVPDIYEHYNIAAKSPAQWVTENLTAHEKVGYDPWLFTEVQLTKYNRPLVALSSNPIDGLWRDRPLPPQDPLRLHPLEYAGESDESKRTRIAASLKADQVLLTSCDSIAWLLNIRGNDVRHTPVVHSFCVLRQDGSYTLFVNPIKLIHSSTSEPPAPTLRTNEFDCSPAPFVLSVAAKQRSRRMNSQFQNVMDITEILPYLKQMQGSCQLDPQTTPIVFLQTLEQTGVEIVRERDPCLLPKALKNATELKGAREAHVQDGIALHHFFEWLEKQPLKGETTEESAAKKLFEFRKEGHLFQDLSFGTISGFGAHGAIIHYQATPESDVPLTRDGLYLLDSGAQYLTGTTDVTRTIALGLPTAEQKDRYTRVLKGHIALAQAIFPTGTTGAQLDSLARQFLWQVGCDYDHGTGHGVGSYLSVHEGPQGISKRASNAPLEPGMILSNEPGYYKEGEYGIRIENMMAVVKLPHMPGFYGFETLTLVPLDLKLIENSLLTDEERAWVEAYHERVREAVRL